jgi:hypothetical protein
MRVYRIQTYPGTEDWANEFLPTLADAEKKMAEATKAELPARLDELEVENGRAGLCDFLNQAVNNHMAQEPSRFIERNY